MNKFTVFSCIRVSEEDYSGPCVIMACVNDPAFMLFFPVSDENAKIISYVLDGNKDYSIDTNVLGLYKTMIDSWRSSDRYLSGILMDSTYDIEMEENILMIRLALANHGGDIDSLVRVNFLHAVLIAAMENVNIIVSDDLIAQMLPPEQSDEIDDDMFLPDEDDEYTDAFGPESPKKTSRISRKKSIEAFDSPEDQNIVEIAKKIMSGKIKEKDDEKDSEPDGDKD